jgi:hypothetical protein
MSYPIEETLSWPLLIAGGYSPLKVPPPIGKENPPAAGLEFPKVNPNPPLG